MYVGVALRMWGYCLIFFLRKEASLFRQKSRSSQVWPVDWHGKVPKYFPVFVYHAQGQAFVKTHEQEMRGL